MHRPKPCNLADKQWHGFTENINRVSEKYDTQNIKTTDHRLIMAVEFHRIKQTIKNTPKFALTLVLKTIAANVSTESGGESIWRLNLKIVR